MTRAVVLVHGLRTSATMWDQQVPLLEAAGRRVWTPDLPGHGTRLGEPFSTEAAVGVIHDAVAEAAEASGGAVDLVGMSVGGMVAIHAAASRPDGIAHVVAANCSTQPTPRTAGVYAWGIAALHGLPGRPARSGGALLRRLLSPAGADGYVRGGTATNDTVRATLKAVASWDLRADLAAIPVPVTVLNNRLDQLRLHERSFAAAAPRGRLVVLPHGTHMSPLVDPQRWTAALLRELG